MLPCSLYIHIPWCIRKCPYCDFNSHKSPSALPEDNYIQALIADLTADCTRFPPKTIQSIFIGGGTPSLFAARSYEKLFSGIQPILPFAKDIEITLEANPGTVEQQRFNDYRKIGINRLSLGIQSFNSHKLHALGRIHDGEQAQRAIEMARKAGFDNINIDIMHSLPGQTIQEGLQDLLLAMTYQPEHISWYQLTIEPNTFFYKHPPSLPNEDTLCRLEDEGLLLLNQRGYQRYEISAFSLPNKQSRHNLNYWLFGDYYGIGAGAHGKLSDLSLSRITRTQKFRQPADYLNPNASKRYLAKEEVISPSSLLFEFMLNTTRLEQPIFFQDFTERTGLPIHSLIPLLEKAAAKNLIQLSEISWQITPFGRRYTNDLQALFL